MEPPCVDLDEGERSGMDNIITVKNLTRGIKPKIRMSRVVAYHGHKIDQVGPGPDCVEAVE